MKLHKLEVYVFDFEEIGIDEIIHEIEGIDYAMARVKASDVISIEDWTDEHELNMTDTQVNVFRKYFTESK